MSTDAESTTPGIDVSRWQGKMNWELVAAAGYRFVVIRATIGDYYTDPRFYVNWSGARAAGLLVSAYHVVTPDRSVDAQVARLFDVLGDRKPDLPLVLDVELSRGVGRAGITACVRDCLHQVEQQGGRKPIVYTGRWFWDPYVLPSPEWAEYDLWIANYRVPAPTLPAGWDSWKFWQHSDRGRVPGSGSARTDLDWFAGSYEDLLQYAQKKPPTPPEPEGGLRACVSVPVLRVHNGPGVKYDHVGDLHAGDVINIVAIDGQDAWVEFDPGKWVSFAFRGERSMEIE